MPNSVDKGEAASALAEAHRRIEPAISRIVRVIAEGEHTSDEPVKLLEVNPETSPSGIIPIAFGPDPPAIPFPSIVIEVTEAEFERLLAGSLTLPEGWRLGDTLYSQAA
jgi:hypothetical protein